jgi:hypothetical protein
MVWYLRNVAVVVILELVVVGSVPHKTASITGQVLYEL